MKPNIAAEITRLGDQQWFSIRITPNVMLGRFQADRAWTVYVDGQELPLVAVYPYDAEGRRPMLGAESTEIGDRWGIEIGSVIHSVETTVLGNTLSLLNHGMRTAANYNPSAPSGSPGASGYAPLSLKFKDEE